MNDTAAHCARSSATHSEDEHMHRHTSRLAAALLLACSAATFAAAPDPAPRIARSVDVVDRVAGLELADPYRWMEGENNAEFDTWLVAEGNDARKALDALPTTAAWQQRLRQASGAAVSNRLVRAAGERLFFLRADGAGAAKLLLRDADGGERVLFDPAAHDDARGPASITEFSPSPDGSRVAINVDRGGNEITDILVFDVADGKQLTDTVGPVWGESRVLWLPEGDAFAYTQLAPPEDLDGGPALEKMRSRLHRLGTPSAQDPVLLRAGKSAASNTSFPLDNEESPSIDPGADSDWVLALAYGARPDLPVCVAKRDAALQPGAPWRCIATYDDAVRAVALHRDTLYLLSVRDAPNGRVLALDLAKPDATLADARVLLPMDAAHVLTDIRTARDGLHVKRMTDGIDGIVRIAHGSTTAAPVTLPFAGTIAAWTSAPTRDGVLFTLRGWTTPGTVLRSTDGTATSLGLDQCTPGDYSDITSTQTEAISADGNHVPLSIVHRRDVRRDGRNRAIVTAYGAYGMPMQPTFNPIYLEWVKAGNIIAVVHTRGGGEKGETWYRAGQGANKQRGIEDYIAGIRAVSAQRYTSPDRTALYSLSMGGILVGGALNQAPDAFGAAIADVAVLNPLRLATARNGSYQFDELGDPTTPGGVQQIAPIDPYHNLRAGTAFPAVLLPVGLNDSRVSPWMTGKYAARLRASSNSGKPVWIRTDASSGHGLATLDAAASLYADVYAFAEAHLRAR